MARHLFDVKLGVQSPKASVTVYTDAACTQVADIQTAAGVAIPGGVVSIGLDRRLTFQGPDKVTALYVKPSTDPTLVLTLNAPDVGALATSDAEDQRPFVKIGNADNVSPEGQTRVRIAAGVHTPSGSSGSIEIMRNADPAAGGAEAHIGGSIGWWSIPGNGSGTPRLDWDMGQDHTTNDLVLAYDAGLSQDVFRLTKGAPWVALSDSALPLTGRRLTIQSSQAVDTALTSLLLLDKTGTSGSPNADHLVCFESGSQVAGFLSGGALTAQTLTVDGTVKSVAAFIYINAATGKQAVLGFKDAGSLKWQQYMINADAHLYFRDVVNSKMHITLTAGTGTGGLTDINSALKVEGNVGFFATTPIAKRATTADATDLASAIALANALKADLVAYGLKS